MELVIEQVFSETADGRIKSISGGRDLQKARKLAKQGLASIKYLGRKFAGYGGSCDVGYRCDTYRVKFL